MCKPTNTEEYFERGDAYRLDGQYEKAIADFSHILALAESDDYDDYNDDYVYGAGYSQVLLRRGLTYAEKGDYDRAIEDYNEAIRIDPEDPLAYDNRGNAYAGTGDHDRAIEDYEKAISVTEESQRKHLLFADFNPNKALIHFDRGCAYIGKGDFDKAIEDFDKAIDISDESADLDPNKVFSILNAGMFTLR